jgi:hypothetical protein
MYCGILQLGCFFASFPANPGKVKASPKIGTGKTGIFIV